MYNFSSNLNRKRPNIKHKIRARVNLLYSTSFQEGNDFLLDDFPQPFSAHSLRESTEHGPGVAALPFLDEAERSTSRVNAQQSCQFSQASDAIHSHDDEGSKEVYRVSRRPTRPKNMKAFPHKLFHKA